MLKSITMDRAEGPVAECGKYTCASFAEAHAKIKMWARSAPDRGGYDKTDVTIVFDGIEPGEDTSLGFRFDMKRDHATSYLPLSTEAIDYAMFSSGNHRPGHMSDEAYERILNGCVGGASERALFGKIAEAIKSAR